MYNYYNQEIDVTHNFYKRGSSSKQIQKQMSQNTVSFQEIFKIFKNISTQVLRKENNRDLKICIKLSESSGLKFP